RTAALRRPGAPEAKQAAKLNGSAPARVGVGFGSAIGGFLGIMEQHEVLQERGPDRISPHFLQNVLVDSASGQLAISLGLRGPNYAPVSACATGSHAVGEAAEIRRPGDADVALALGRGNLGVVVCVKAPGTATRLADLAETKALTEVFGVHAYTLAVSSTVWMMGHCFGAVGAIEALMCVTAIEEGVVLAAIN